MDLSFHPVADLFPLMSDAEHRELREDIRQNGLREPIWLHEGRIIGGRNRYRCCQELGIAPPTREWVGHGSLAAFVMSLNLHRRHLTAGQRAIVAAKALPLFEAEARERQRQAAHATNRQRDCPTLQVDLPEASPAPAPQARDRAGAEYGVGARTVQSAKTILVADPGLADQVLHGQVKLSDALRQVRRAQERERRAAAPLPPLPAEVTLEQADTTSHLPDGTFDLILTDPPYNISDAGKLTKVGDAIEPAVFSEEWDCVDGAQYRANLSTWAEEWARLLRPGGAVVSFIDRAMLSYLWGALQMAGLTPKSPIGWVKHNPSPTGLVRRHLISAMELLVWAVKPGVPWTFNAVEGWDRRNVIETNIISAAEKVEHPTQKPLAVLRPLIELTTHPGDLILDPFAGSGSTGLAALRLGRRCHLIEREADYVTLARYRLSQEGGSV